MRVISSEMNTVGALIMRRSKNYSFFKCSAAIEIQSTKRRWTSTHDWNTLKSDECRQGYCIAVVFVPSCRTGAAFSPTWGVHVLGHRIARTFTDVRNSVFIHQHSQAVMWCTLQLYWACYAIIVPVVWRIIGNYRFETFDAELQRMHN